jgi:opacity protein-like surface antigen
MFRKLIALILVLFWANSAYGLIDMELSAGERWYKAKDSEDAKLSFRGRELNLGVNLDPFPIVPISFGASYSVINLNLKDLENADEAEINQLGLDVKAWLPVLPYTNLYARLRYLISGNLKIRYNDATENIDTDLYGYTIGVGVSYIVIPLVSVQFEVQQSVLRAKSFADTAQTMNSRGILIGVSLGI